ncbi:beta-carotene 15,15'-monooxygenase, partial [Staphylococcus lugdunensis]
ALIILFTATKILVTPAMKDIAGKDIVALMMLLFFITVVFLVIDIISWLKRKQFVFITIKPLFVFGLYILLFIWLP